MKLQWTMAGAAFVAVNALVVAGGLGVFDQPRRAKEVVHVQSRAEVLCEAYFSWKDAAHDMAAGMEKMCK
jgi:hypothetical protein